MEPRYMQAGDTPLLTVPVGELARLAYLFLHVSFTSPSRLLHLPSPEGRRPATPSPGPAGRYLDGSRGHLRLGSTCGLSCEKLAYHAVRACITKHPSYVNEFLSSLPQVLAPGPTCADELLHGRAGTLYLLRMMRHCVPDTAVLLDRSVQSLATTILAAGPGWEWHRKRYLGAVHGDIGIVTQLALAMPSLADPLEDKLRGACWPPGSLMGTGRARAERGCLPRAVLPRRTRITAFSPISQALFPWPPPGNRREY